MKPFFKYFITSLVAAGVAVAGVRVYDYFTQNNDFTADEYGSKLISKLNKINDIIKNEYLYDDYNLSDMDEAAVKAYVEGLDEPYTHYYTAKEFKSFTSNVEDSYVGIGIVITSDKEADKILIIAPTEDSPARDAGLLPGDHIISVDDTAFSGDELDECVTMIKSGKAGSVVKITVERDGEVLEYNIERKEILLHSVRSEMLDNNIGYIRISEFNTSSKTSGVTTYTEFCTHMDELRAAGMQKLIIDVRDNPGGILTVACQIADYLLPSGIITYTEDKNGKRTEYRSDANELDMPMVILINENSASAAEILTGALKGHDKAKAVGDTSFGKGIVQEVIPLPDGSGLTLTTSNYYTPDGICIHGVGIEPDYKIDLPEKFDKTYISEIPHEEDTQLRKAIELLR